ncbi:hypothetical protein JCM19240_3979 [Vibrio maritimus]|uniref:Uncharacterized protein n=1 Tax=Vibrio maritimus TaxID=990268 RepID=A0A090TG44_9VIBR|nr:hypothetical protein JCM19240_3979 [Vibrio maritimus]
MDPSRSHLLRASRVRTQSYRIRDNDHPVRVRLGDNPPRRIYGHIEAQRHHGEPGASGGRMKKPTTFEEYAAYYSILVEAVEAVEMEPKEWLERFGDLETFSYSIAPEFDALRNKKRAGAGLPPVKAVEQAASTRKRENATKRAEPKPKPKPKKPKPKPKKPRPLKDITGQRFGKLVALEEVEPTKRKAWATNRRTGEKALRDVTERRYLCKCDCGTEKVIRMNSLTSNNTKSCGCVIKDMHERWGARVFPKTDEQLERERLEREQFLTGNRTS